MVWTLNSNFDYNSTTVNQFEFTASDLDENCYTMREIKKNISKAIMRSSFDVLLEIKKRILGL